MVFGTFILKDLTQGPNFKEVRTALSENSFSDGAFLTFLTRPIQKQVKRLTS